MSENSAEKIATYLSGIVQGLVANKEAVSVEFKKDDMGVLFTVHLDPDDAGKVIGRGGNTAKAIRTIAYSVGFMNDMKASVQFDVPDVR